MSTAALSKPERAAPATQRRPPSPGCTAPPWPRPRGTWRPSSAACAACASAGASPSSASGNGAAASCPPARPCAAWWPACAARSSRCASAPPSCARRTRTSTSATPSTPPSTASPSRWRWSSTTSNATAAPTDAGPDAAARIVREFAAALPAIRELLDSDVEAAYRGDPPPAAWTRWCCATPASTR
jgi:hypothetical protein